MKKLVIMLTTACAMLSCEITTNDVAANKEIIALYQESLTLNNVAPDSVARFATKVNNYMQANPNAKYDEHYNDIVSNIHKVYLTISVGDFETITINYE